LSIRLSFSPLLETTTALAELGYGDKIQVEISGGCDYGCN